MFLLLIKRSFGTTQDFRCQGRQSWLRNPVEKELQLWLLQDCNVSPPIPSICIRAGWVMGRVKYKYLKRESAGDQYVWEVCIRTRPAWEKQLPLHHTYFNLSLI